MRISTHGLFGFFAFLAASCVATIATARTNTVRIVTYNIEADTPGIETPGWTTPRPGLIQPADNSGNAVGTTAQGGVVEAIGQLPLGTSNNNQPLDIMVLQETTSNTLTVDPIVSAMNTYYGVAGMYARSPTQGTQNGGNTFGNGPNALVYNTQKLDLIASVGVGTPSGASNGEYRQVMRYQFRPDGGTSADDFYVYVSHYKSGGGATNENARLGEANIIRNNAATLPSNSRIIYTGDYNVQLSSEAGYQKILSNSQINQGWDPYNLTASTSIDWSANSNLTQKTHSATSLGNRYDYMIMTSNMAPDSTTFSPTSSGLQLIPGTHGTFGNNGTTGYHSSTDSAGNTALNAMVQVGSTSFISASTAKNDLTWASDHLPVLGDFSLGPGISIWNGAGTSSNWNTSQDWDSAPIDGDSLQFAGSTRLTNSNNSLSVVGAITFNSGAGTFTLSGNAVTNYGGITNNSTNSQNVNINQTLGAAQQFNAASGNISVGGSVANGGNTLTIAGSSNVTLGSTVSGAGGLIKNGAGVVILNGTNSYTGGTTITAGTAQLGNAGGLGSSNSSTTVNGGTLDLHGFSAAVGALNGTGGTIQTNVAGAATLSVGGSLATGAYSGQIQNGSGTVALIKTGVGTQTLSGNNSYSGGTTVTGGTLQLGHANALGTGGVAVVGSSTLDLHGFSPTVGALNGNAISHIQSNVAGAVTFTVGNGGASGSYSGIIQNNAGTVGLVKTGAGTQILSGNNSYSGGTTVSGGTLQLGNVNAMGSNTAGVTVNAGTLELSGYWPTIGALGGSGGTIQSSAAVAVLTVGNGGAGGSYAGIIANGSGTVSLIKTGGGTQTLTGNNSYSGGTTVTTGTLIAGHVNALGTGGLTINNTATTKLQAALSAPVQLPSLSLAGGGSPTATLDITDNNLILHSGNLATTTAQIANAFLTGGGGLWTGAGITSSLAEPDVTLHAVGVVSNDDSQLGGGGDPLFGTWPTGADSGSAVTTVASDVLVKYTYFGDADLSGDVDTSNDYGLWLLGFTGSGTGWLFGDFDYSGGATDNSSDFGLWLAGLTGQGAPLVGGGVQPVPEPSTIVLAALGLAGLAAAARIRRRAD